MSTSKLDRKMEGSEDKRVFSAVGKRATSPETMEKSAGTATFVSDVRLPGMLVGKVLRSPHAHALVTRIDKSKAEDLLGVEAVITAADVKPWHPYNRGFEDLPVLPGVEPRPSTEPILKEEVRHYGDAVAAVAAANDYVAEEALSLIEVEYEELPFFLDAEKALRADEAGNLLQHMDYPFAEGNTKEAFEKADLVLTRAFSTSKQEHSTLEPAGAVARVDVGGRLQVWSGCQNPNFLRRALGRVFDLPVGMIQVFTPYAGGKFGQGLSFGPEPIACALALKTGRPVKIVYSREENFTALETRVPSKYTISMGFAKDGTLLGIEIHTVDDLGAYPGAGPMAASIETVFGLGHYKCSNRAGTQDMVLTNNPVGGGMRGVGNTAITWGVEQVMDEAATALNVDPIDLRLRNIKKAGDISSLGGVIESYYLTDCLRLGAEKIGWKEKRKAKSEGQIRRGVGVATMSHASGAAALLLNHSTAFIKMNEDGSANLVVNAARHGQLTGCSLAQIAAEELGIPLETIHVFAGDTDLAMFEFGAGASRQCYVIGGAVKEAAREAKEGILRRASRKLGASEGDLETKDGEIFVKGSATAQLTVAEVCADALYNLEGDCSNIRGSSSFESSFNSIPAGAFFAEVAVDTETGEVKVERFVTAMDCGKAINPMTVESQLEGALSQGLGYALTEDYEVDPVTGKVLTDNWTTYKTLGPLDMPEVDIILVDKPDPKGPFGAKGVGENGIVGVAPAIASAVYDAIGVRIRDLPITAEKVLEALDVKKEKDK